MKEFKKILVPVDGSELSKKAFQKAVSLADLVDSSVDVIHVQEYPPTGPVGMEQPVNLEPGKVPRFTEIYKEMGKKMNTEIGTINENGTPSKVIIDRSSEYDLIIMGTHGKNPLASLVLGSVAEKVARNACCPVMLIREKGNSC